MRPDWVVPPALRSGAHEKPEAVHAWLQQQREYQDLEGQLLLDAHWAAHNAPQEARAMMASDAPEDRAFLKAHGVYLDFDTNVSNALGYISTGLNVGLYRVTDWGDRDDDAFYNSVTHTIMMRSNISDDEMLLAWAHELAHAFLHRNMAHDNQAVRIATAEVEAQSTSLLLMAKLGMNAFPYTVLYLSGWTPLVGWVAWRRAAAKAKVAARMMTSLLPVAPEDE